MSYFIATAIVLASHVALAFLWTPYLQLLLACGAMVSHGNDIADLPRQGLLGHVIVGMFWIVLVNGYVAFVRRAGSEP